MVSESLSSNEGSGGDSTVAPLITYAEKFDELFPYYLSIGMSEEQFWDKDPQLVKAFRKAEELRVNRRNEEMWLQGRYIYEAICCVSPILHAFAKKGTKPQPYMEEPFSITQKQVDAKEEEKTKKTYEKGKRFMEKFALETNKKFEGK